MKKAQDIVMRAWNPLVCVVTNIENINIIYFDEKRNIISLLDRQTFNKNIATAEKSPIFKSRKS